MPADSGPAASEPAHSRPADSELADSDAADSASAASEPAEMRAAGRSGIRQRAAVEALAGLRQNLADLQGLADQEREYLGTLESRIEGAVVKVPYLSKDVHDLESLGLVAECLTGQVLSGRA